MDGGIGISPKCKIQNAKLVRQRRKCKMQNAKLTKRYGRGGACSSRKVAKRNRALSVALRQLSRCGSVTERLWHYQCHSLPFCRFTTQSGSLLKPLTSGEVAPKVTERAAPEVTEPAGKTSEAKPNQNGDTECQDLAPITR